MMLEKICVSCCIGAVYMFGAFAGAQALPEPVCIAVLAINILLLNYLYKKRERN
jgi:hypothetical protein